MKNENFIPSEIKERNPSITWTPQQIGYLFNLGLIDGIKKTRYTFVNEKDVLKIYEQVKN